MFNLAKFNCNGRYFGDNSLNLFFKGEPRYGNLNTLVFVDSEYFEYL